MLHNILKKIKVNTISNHRNISKRYLSNNSFIVPHDLIAKETGKKVIDLQNSDAQRLFNFCLQNLRSAVTFPFYISKSELPVSIHPNVLSIVSKSFQDAGYIVKKEIRKEEQDYQSGRNEWDTRVIEKEYLMFDNPFVNPAEPNK